MTAFCPDDETLALWIERKLEEGPRRDVSRHLAACDSCRRAATLSVLAGDAPSSSLAPAFEEQARSAVERALGRPSTCPSEDQLGAWLADELGVPERTSVSEHLSSCDECRRAAALTRLAKDSPIAALVPAQEQAALAIVLRQVRRTVFFTAGRLAAAAVLVGVATTYVAVQWNAGLTAPVAAGTPSRTPEPRDPGPAFVVPRVPPSPGSPTPAPPAPSEAPVPTAAPEAPAPEVPAPAPAPEPSVVPPPPPAPAPKEPGRTRAEIASRFAPVPVLEWTSTPVDGKTAPAELAFGSTVRTDRTTTINLAGRALVTLDAGAEAGFGRGGPSAFALQLVQGACVVDSARSEQRWEFWNGERPLVLEKLDGRIALEAGDESLRVILLAGTAKLERGASLEPGSQVILTAAGTASGRDAAAARKLSDRHLAQRPREMVVARATPGKAGPAVAGDPSVPECADPIHWTRFEIPGGVTHSTRLSLRVRYVAGGPRLWLSAEGYRRELRATRLDAPLAETWGLQDLKKDRVDLIPGEPLAKFAIGVVQDGGALRTLEVGSVDVVRSLD